MTSSASGSMKVVVKEARSSLHQQSCQGLHSAGSKAHVEATQAAAAGAFFSVDHQQHCVSLVLVLVLVFWSPAVTHRPGEMCLPGVSVQLVHILQQRICIVSHTVGICVHAHAWPCLVP